MTQPDRGYIVRIWTEGIDTAQYRSRVVAEGPLDAIHQELEHIADVDPAGLLEGRYGAVATAVPIEDE